jgi:PAS domain S-box-containing protein
MKNQISPTGREISLNEKDFIVSKPDIKGRISYANRIFMRISGYGESELLGHQHNIIRHPDMPRGVFRLLGQPLEAGNECFAYVKNMTKNGDFYWVFANVTIDHDSDKKPIGYFSVRRQPSQKAIDAIEPIYSEMLKIEQQAGGKEAPDASLQWLTQVLDSKDTVYEQFMLTL